MLHTTRLLRAALLCAAILVPTLPAALRAAENDADTLRQIDWSAAPAYIQGQIKNLVLHCTNGALTPNKARVFEYSSPAFPEKRHYLIDYLAWMHVPPVDACNYGPKPCESDSCLLFAYTMQEDGSFSLATRLSIRKLDFTESVDSSGPFPLAEITQDPMSCRAANGGKNTCRVRLTWHGGKFRFFGFGDEENIKPFTTDSNGEVIPPPDMPVMEEPKSAPEK